MRRPRIHYDVTVMWPQIFTSGVATGMCITLRSHGRHGVSIHRLFVQQFVQANNKVNIKAPRDCFFVRDNPPVTGGFLSQRASNAEIISIA